MTSTVCKAKVKANCRTHGYGTDFEPELYEKFKISIEESLDNLTRWMTSEINPSRIPEEELPPLLEKHAKMRWEQMRPIDNRLKKQKKALAFNLPVPEGDGLDTGAALIFNNSTELTVAISGGKTAYVKEVTNATVAKNACAVVSMKLVDNFPLKESWNSETEPVIVRRDAYDTKKPVMFWHHAAIQVTKNGEPWVIDYTIRQFNTKLPFPYVAKLNDWEKTLNDSTGEQWVEKNLTDWTVETGYPNNKVIV